MKNKLRRLDYNSPVVLTMAALAFVILLVNYATGGGLNRVLAVRYTSWADPMMYLRMFTHVLAHADLAHFTGNFLFILAVGPMVEEKYGSRRLLGLIALTAFVTGLVNVIFFHGVALIGASGVLFMLILLSSFTNIREGRIPLTFILVALLYLGNEIVTGVIQSDNISQFSHVIGGICGGFFGFFIHGGIIRGPK